MIFDCRHNIAVVSIRAPREGGDRSWGVAYLRGRFQSAPPVKGATTTGDPRAFLPAVSIRAPREGGDSSDVRRRGNPRVSIRAPREGGDRLAHALRIRLGGFNPRPP